MGGNGGRLNREVISVICTWLMAQPSPGPASAESALHQQHCHKGAQKELCHCTSSLHVGRKAKASFHVLALPGMPVLQVQGERGMGAVRLGESCHGGRGG